MLRTREPYVPVGRIIHEKSGHEVAERVTVARSLFSRLCGLMRRQGLPEGSALVIPGCRQIHTFLMRFPMDVVFMDDQSRVVGMEEGIRPYRISAYHKSADRAIELPAGNIAACGITVGDVLLLK